MWTYVFGEISSCALDELKLFQNPVQNILQLGLVCLVNKRKTKWARDRERAEREK